MNQITETLFEGIETGTIEEKSGNLLVLGDDIEFAHFKEDDIREIVQRLINILSRENDWSVIKLLFRSISIAYMGPTDLTGMDYEPLINILDNSEPRFINGVIYVLSMTYERKFVPLISKYLDHGDETVRQEAQDAIAYMNK